MYHKGCITDLINIGGYPFEGSPMVDVCIMKFVKGGHGETTVFHMDVSESSIRLEKENKQDDSKANGLVRLKTIAQIRRGITTGANKFFVNPPLFTQDHVVSVVSSPKDISGYSTKYSRKDGLLVLRSSDKLCDEERQYLYNCSASIVRNGKPKTLKTLIEKGESWYEITVPEVAQIVFPYIVRKNVRFILNDGGYNVRDNFYMISSKYNSLLLLALLNNYHVYAQLECLGKNYGNGVLKVQKYDLDNVVIPKIETMAQVDKDKLTLMSRELVDSSNGAIVGEITSVLNAYYGTCNADRQYDMLKNKRLSKYEE